MNANGIGMGNVPQQTQRDMTPAEIESLVRKHHPAKHVEPVRVRVLLGIPVSSSEPARDFEGSLRFAAGYISGYTGNTVSIETHIGSHDFLRSDGTWCAGPCTNFAEATILDHEEVEAAIRAGFYGDVKAYRDSCKAAPPDAATPQSRHR